MGNAPLISDEAKHPPQFKKAGVGGARVILPGRAGICNHRQR